jgi:hypothetical protein
MNGRAAGQSGETRWVTLSTLKTRTVAMGGAFVSVKDGLATLDYNPAAFALAPSAQPVQCAVYLNPMAPLIMRENCSQKMDWDVQLGWLLYGAGVSVSGLTIGFIWGEEVLSDKNRLERSHFFDAAGYENQRNASFGISLQLAPRVSLGLAGEVFIREKDGDNRWRMGYRYGVILKPKNNLNVGLCFVDFPNEYKEDRMNLDRLVDETLNIGVCYSPWRFLRMALDVRNVSDEGKGAAREPHVGIEVTSIERFSFRVGYFRKIDEKRDVYSLGLGFKTLKSDQSVERIFFNPAFGFDTSLIWDWEGGQRNRWFFITCMLSI